MKLVYLGTPEMAVPPLRAVVAAGHEIVLVVTGADKRRGRRGAPTPSPVKSAATELGLTVSHEIADVHAAVAQGAELGVVVAFGTIIKRDILDALPLVNVHFSLLPRWRGAAPVARAIEAGDSTTGITIMQVEAGLDSGPILLAEATPIEPTDSTATLTERLASIGARLIVTALGEAAAGRLRAVPQPTEGVTYAHKLEKREAWLDFALDAALLARKVRAFDPFPGACAALDGTTLKFWRARAAPAATVAAPGTVINTSAAGLHIACGQGVLVVTELQRAGSKRLPAREFLAGSPVAVGTVLTLPPVATGAGP